MCNRIAPPSKQPWLMKSDKGSRSSKKNGCACNFDVHVRGLPDTHKGRRKIGTKDASECNSEATLLPSPVVDLMTKSQDGQGSINMSPLTSDMVHCKLVGTLRGPAPTAAEPVLLTHKRHEKKTFKSFSLGRNKRRFLCCRWALDRPLYDLHWRKWHKKLEVPSVVTSATGNCMAMAIVQALEETLWTDYTIFSSCLLPTSNEA